jgi:ATP-dependent Zn protease
VTVRRLLQAIWVLLVQFWREKTRRLEAPPVAPLPKTDETKTAIHEAGHVIAAWFCTFVDDVKLARSEATGGEVQYTVHDVNIASVAWCRMVIALAGVAAEARVFKRWRSIESRSDLNRARELCARVVGTKPPWEALEPAPQHFESAFEATLSKSEAEAIRHAYAMAKLLVQKHEIRLYRCAGLLLHRRVVSNTDLKAVFGSRTLIRVASTTRGFWLP